MEDLSNFTIGNATNVLEFWKEFDLDTRRLTLDQNCVDMREMKTSSINGRKRLNDATKNFRSKSRDEQTTAMTELLKLYQEEIDQLSRRSKFSESAFYSLYKSIYDAPNPSTCIEGLIDMVAATSTNQLEIERLKGELAQYDQEFQLLKNQDITIRRLEDQLEEYKEQIEDKVMEEVMKRTSQIEEQAEIRIGEVREIQRVAEKRLAAVVESMRQAQSSTDRAQTQMFEISSQAEERVSALSAENTILAEGTERALARVAELEGEISNVRALSLSGGMSGGGMGNSQRGSGGKGDEDYETLHLVITELRQEIRLKEDALRVEKQRLEAKHRETTQLLSREKDALGKVRLELTERPTKEDLFALRRQLRMLQRVAFNVQEEDEGEASSMGESKTIPLGDIMPMELLLTSRMKTLDTELAECKRSLRAAKEQENIAREAAAALRVTVETSTGLISRLEADLETQMERRGGSGYLYKKGPAQSRSQSPAPGSGTMELSELLGVGIKDIANGSSDTSLSGLNMTFDNNGGAEGFTGGKGLAGRISDIKIDNTVKEKEKGGSQQMVDILQAQRDRYKDRLSASESVAVSVQNKLAIAENSKAQLERDNVALYSKIRYLQSITGNSSTQGKSLRIKGTGSKTDLNYTAGMMGGRDEEAGYRSSYSRTSKGGNGGYRDDVESMEDEGSGRDGDRDMEGRYGALYEQRMNPFEEFSHIEKQRRLQDLSVADRIVLNTTLAFISSKSGRSFIVIYLGSMHLLVFLILYFFAHHVQHGCDPSMDALQSGGLIGGHLD